MVAGTICISRTAFLPQFKIDAVTMKSMKNSMFFLVMFHLFVSAHSAPKPPTKAEQKKLISKLHNAVVESLKDPDAAKFRKEFLSWSESEEDPKIALCGEMNGKNSYGGYTGFGPFIATSDGQIMVDGNPSIGSFEYLWPVWCSKPIK